MIYKEGVIMFFDGFNLISINENKSMYLHQQNLIEKYLNTNDENIIIQIAILISLSPIADYIEAINILKKLSLVTDNINVYILGSYLIDEYVFDEENYFLDFLINSLNCAISKKNKGIVYYLIGKHLKKVSQKEKAVYYFKKSIECDSKCVNSCLELSRLLPECEQKYSDMAKSNVECILSKNFLSKQTLEYFTSFDNFVEEFILGIKLPEPIYEIYFGNIGMVL